jgi:hypothetical protein
VLVYTDSYAVDALGHFNVKFNHDGVYTLARLDINSQMLPEPLYDPYQA